MHTRNLLSSLLLVFVLALVTAGSPLADTGAVPERDEIDDQYKWKVEHIYESLEQWEQDFETVKAMLPRFDAYQGHLGDSPASIWSCLKLSDSVSLIANNLYVYAYLKLDEDNRQSQYQELGGRASTLWSQIGQATSFIEPEIIALGAEALDGMLAESSQLAEYEFYLRDLLRRNEHVLSPEQERLLALASPVTGAPQRIFSMINDADIDYGTIIGEDGKEVELSKERYYKIMDSFDRDLRKRASLAYNTAYLDYVNTLGATLGSSMKKDWFYAQAREYNSCLEASLDRDSVPVDVVHALVDAVNANLEPLHKLTGLRKRMLGYDTLYSYDLSVPLLPEMKREFTYDEAKAILLKGLKPLGDDYLKDLEMGLSSGWVDVYENQGKGSGAYSWGTYATHPYVLMNFNGTIEAVFTLAHEMGHAMNSYYTRKNEPYHYGYHSLFTAEVASTCNEAIIMKYLLEQTDDRAEKLMLLNHYINQVLGTFYTQVMFTEFELATHEHIEAGGEPSSDYFRQVYRDIYQKYWGSELVIPENYDQGCLRIGHFYRAFYVYQYATSYAAAQSLSQQILDGDRDALQRYHQFLATGSSQYPINILKDAGVDLTGPEPVQRTIALFSELVDEMERLLNEG